LTLNRLALAALKYVLLAGALAVTAGLSALVTMRVVLLSQEVTVPSLLGKRIPEAGLLAKRNRLQLRVEGKRNDPSVPADAIVAQEPSGGSALKTNRSIRVWLSLGPRRVSIPAVEGQALRAARLTFEQAQIPVSRVVQVNDTAAEGTVLIQHPPAGDTQMAVPSASLLVSLGPARTDYVMPDLIGRASSRALPALEAVGLRVANLHPRSYPGAAPGTILRQSPPAGSRVSSGTPIELDVTGEAP
jgi:beta-lactam-binding protein with PASTA domain